MRWHRRPAELVLLLALAACAGKPPPASPGKTDSATPGVKIGKPYQVYGVWYYPADDRTYDARGIASWYGPGFHALSTANGERYDQDDVTAAHKTLPMPSWVEVENLDNGRRLTVRINDRGPFVAGRIIDLSRKSAQLLGVDRPGTARVRVRRVFPDTPLSPVVPAATPPPPLIETPANAAPAISVADVAPPAVATVAVPGGASPPAVAAPPVSAGALYVQVAALSDAGRIAWLSGYLAGFGSVVTERTASGLTRVRLGPYGDTDSANAALAKLRAAGYTDARLVVPPPAP
ncbi:MAG: septal ring lytic transglycosylase RlpA family lipoprotein [Alphaproteobacteria bacterium PA4]|nr:MAG: septal ring lytic transglycosylase RlpA family lipoprotein [Alphaproteobacteria bacterium PA4]